MKYKVGDKVRIKSKKWWNAQPKNENGDVECGADTFTDIMTCLCGKVVEISDILDDVYSIKGYDLNWTDEMFDDSFSYNPEKSIISEEMIKDISEVVKKHNLGVSISENDGKLIIEPLNVDKYDDLALGSPVMVSNNNEYWYFSHYVGRGRAFIPDGHGKSKHWEYIIEFEKFNPYNLEESLKYNIVK